jgi:hypothetical protein
MYCKIKGEIEDLGKGTINPRPNTLKLIASWVENEKGDYGEEDGEN